MSKSVAATSTSFWPEQELKNLSDQLNFLFVFISSFSPYFTKPPRNLDLGYSHLVQEYMPPTQALDIGYSHFAQGN